MLCLLVSVSNELFVLGFVVLVWNWLKIEKVFPMVWRHGAGFFLLLVFEVSAMGVCFLVSWLL
jgi:hypothetical protein